MRPMVEFIVYILVVMLGFTVLIGLRDSPKEIIADEYPIRKIITPERCLEQYNMVKSSLIIQYGKPKSDSLFSETLYDSIDYKTKQTTWEYKDTTIILSVTYNTFKYNDSSWIDYSSIIVKKQFKQMLFKHWFE
jgi:hypothetical protein